MADRLGVDFALFNKERKKANEVSRMILIGNVQGKVAILVDDMADTCGTLALAAKHLAENGAERSIAIVTHGVLSPPALDTIMKSQLEKLIVTNTIPQSSNARKCPKIEQIDISHVLAETIRRSHYGESISVLFNQVPYDTTQPYRHGTDTPGLEDGGSYPGTGAASPASLGGASGGPSRSGLNGFSTGSGGSGQYWTSRPTSLSSSFTMQESFPPSSYNEPDPPAAANYFASDQEAENAPAGEQMPAQQPPQMSNEEQPTPRLRHADAAGGRFESRKVSAESIGAEPSLASLTGAGASRQMQSPPPPPGGHLPPAY